MTDKTVEINGDDREYTLDELSKLADVSPRTVRYYIVEGLLPPPLTTGRNATYSQDHLDRLNAIAALKEMYLPLREIRHRLNTLTSEQMRDPAYLASLSQAVAMEKAMGRGRGHGERRMMSRRMGAEAVEQFEQRGRGRGRPHREDRFDRNEGPIVASMMAPPEEAPDFQASQTWERFPLGDDAELLIRSSKAQNMGPRLHRTLHRLRHMIEMDNDDERNRR